MSLKRENDFPATSIGRSSGARLQQAAAAHEAHPLLSPTPSEQSLPSGTTANGAPRYVPYTPRQRVTPTAATTGTTVHPPSPQQHQGDATSKLQLMHLKAAAQAIGLDSGTLGWVMLEKLVVDVENSEEWTEVWTVITSGKATLLLPLESTSYEKITPDFMKDHIILCDSPSRKDTPIVTLSGLRGTLDDETLTFRSTINPTCKLFQDLLTPSTRTTALSHLPPLPTSTKYPKFQLPSYSSNLHVPPRAAASKPPLPPRPNNRPAPPTRIGNPFASLFGGSARSPNPPVPPSPTSSLLSFESDTSTSFEVPGFAIDRRIVRKDLAKELNKALKAEIKASLSVSSCPSWLVERVHDAAAPWFPFIKTTAPSRRKLGQEKEGNGNGNAYIVNPFEENPQDCAEHLQDIYLALEQDLRMSLPKKREKEAESDMEVEKEREKRESERMETEIWVREVMEVVERTITSLFYDRLFMQSTTDDASHDEALSSRIAALNMLDLGLGHLGIDVGEVDESDLDAVVKACGDVLTKLETLRYPAEKAASLVEAHKIVVDGLSKLPPVHLISENNVNVDEEDLPTAKPQSSTSDEGQSSVAYAEQPIAPAVLPASSLGLESTDPPLPSLPSDSPLAAPASSGSDLKSSTSGARTKTVPPPLPLDSPSASASPAASGPVPSRPSEKRSDAQKDPTPVSGDVLLPMIIFSVVKANPPRLVSNLLFTQRFRNQSVGGEESYCLINMMAVAEFLENVDMAGLGLGDSDKVMSTADLTPIPLTRSPITAETPLLPADAAHGGLRGRVEQQVDAIADSANKVISGVVDSSFGILRSFMPGTTANPIPLSPGSGRTTPGTPGSAPKQGFGLLRRESGFSIASLAASLPIPVARSRAASTIGGEEGGQQLVSVSRPSSVRSRASLKIRVGGDDDDEGDSQDDSDDGGGSVSGTTDDEESEQGEEGREDGEDSGRADVRSIRSFESMLSASRKSKSANTKPRKTLSDRLASVSALAGFKQGTSPPNSRRSSMLQPHPSGGVRPGSPSTSRPTSPVQHHPSLRLAPPKQRFIECTPDDLRLSEIGELLRDYRRLVEGIRAVNGFDE